MDAAITTIEQEPETLPSEGIMETLGATLMPEPPKYDGRKLAEVFATNRCETVAEKMTGLIEVLKTTDIKGCITGSCMLESFDPDEWDTEPDVDLFVFSETELQHAIDVARYALGMKLGKGDTRTAMQEEWKYGRLRKSGVNRKIGITTYTLYYDGVKLNVTFKMTKVDNKWVPVHTTEGVLQTFDMSICMIGYDIPTHVLHDCRFGDVNTAIPNPLREYDCEMWTVRKWVRQFDRVVKYYNRGFDTRPMARFYLKMINECLAKGCIFDSEESQALFDEASAEFKDYRKRIAAWVREHKED